MPPSAMPKYGYDDHPRRAEARNQLIACSVFEGGSDDTIALSRGMNVLEDAAHPGVRADMRVGSSRTAESGKDINDSPITLHICRQVPVDILGEGYRVGADVLIGIVVVHED